MKRIIGFLAVLLCIATHIDAQVHFAYDSDGNMTQRRVVIVSSKVDKNNPQIINPVFDNVEEQKITLYPNPTKGVFQIGVTQLDSKKKNLAVLYSLNGIKLIELNLSSDLTSVDLSEKPSGVYLLDIYLGEKISRWKVIKE